MSAKQIATDWLNEKYVSSSFEEKEVALAYLQLAIELEKVKIECSGMGKVLSSGVYVNSEEYSILIKERNELKAELAALKEDGAEYAAVMYYKELFEKSKEREAVLLEALRSVHEYKKLIWHCPTCAALEKVEGMKHEIKEVKN